jgi:hypothetical protein
MQPHPPERHQAKHSQQPIPPRYFDGGIAILPSLVLLYSADTFEIIIMTVLRCRFPTVFVSLGMLDNGDVSQNVPLSAVPSPGCGTQ